MSRRILRSLRLLNKVRHYRLLVILEASFYLHKYHFLIAYKDYTDWMHHLVNIDFVSQDLVRQTRVRHKSIAPQKNARSSMTPEAAKLLNSHLQAVVRHSPVELNCLRRCLALKAMIERREGNCKLHIGVKINGKGKLLAHSWLSVDDALVNDSVANVNEYREITHTNSLFFRSFLCY